MRPLIIGSRGTYQHHVTDQDAATNWANDLPVLATPVLVWAAEVACMDAIEDALEADEMTVGFAHREAKHLAATPVGWTVTVRATLTHVDGKLVTFDVEAHDGKDTVFTGTHVRAVIGRSKFIERFDRKAAAA